MTQFSNPFERLSLAALLIVACSRTQNLEFKTQSLEPEPPRRAPGVAVDPAHELPPPAASQDAQGGLAVLKAPASAEPDEGLVERFFQAVTERDANRLEMLLLPGAKLRTSAQAGEVDALDFWKSRLSRLDYSKLGGQSIYRRHAVEVYRGDDLRILGNERHLPASVEHEQVLIRVPLHAVEGDKVRLFGSEIVFVLAPTADGLRIAEMIEDFQLP